MKSKRFVALQVLLWGICAFHIIIGLGLNVSPDFPQLVAQYYGAEVAWTPEFLYVVKPVGAFMLVFGVLVGVAARDPLAHGPIVYGAVLLFILRGLQRIVFQDEIGAALAIGASRNIGNAIFFLLLAAVVFLLYRAASSRAVSVTRA